MYEYEGSRRRNSMGSDDSNKTDGIKPTRDAYTEITATSEGKRIPADAYDSDERAGTSDNPRTNDPRHSYVPTGEIPDNSPDSEQVFLAREKTLLAEGIDPAAAVTKEGWDNADTDIQTKETRIAWKNRAIDTRGTVSSEQFANFDDNEQRVPNTQIEEKTELNDTEFDYKNDITIAVEQKFDNGEEHYVDDIEAANFDVDALEKLPSRVGSKKNKKLELRQDFDSLRGRREGLRPSRESKREKILKNADTEAKEQKRRDHFNAKVDKLVERTKQKRVAESAPQLLSKRNRPKKIGRERQAEEKALRKTVKKFHGHNPGLTGIKDTYDEEMAKAKKSRG